MQKKYLTGLDFLRVFCMGLYVILCYSLPLYFAESYKPLLGFSAGTLFCIYGFCSLQDETNLAERIRRCLVAFSICFAGYAVLLMLFCRVLYGTFFPALDARALLNFAVLNYWPTLNGWPGIVGQSIWLLQAALYSVLLCALFRRCRKWDWLICIILFVFSFYSGDGAALCHFNLLGNEYIPGNFLTRALPYMLLGRIIWRKQQKLCAFHPLIWVGVVIVGFVLAMAELYLFARWEIMIYSGHLLGFIPVTVGLCVLALQLPSPREHSNIAVFVKYYYRWLYYAFNPLAELLSLFGLFIYKTYAQYALFYSVISVLVLITVAIPVAILSVCKAAKTRLCLAQDRVSDTVEENELDALEALLEQNDKEALQVQQQKLQQAAARMKITNSSMEITDSQASLGWIGEFNKRKEEQDAQAAVLGMNSERFSEMEEKYSEQVELRKTVADLRAAAVETVKEQTDRTRTAASLGKRNAVVQNDEVLISLLEDDGPKQK